MAAVNQSFMFGDFDDLTPDEHQRIQNILHGYKEPSSKKVEFPWDDSGFIYEGAMAGPDVYYANTELEFGGTVYAEMPPYPVEINPQENNTTAYQAEQYQQQFNFPEDDQQRIESEPTFNQISSIGSGDLDTPVNSPNPSKLQASLKPYERRNKKKRPPGYYSQAANEANLTHVESEDNLQGMDRSEAHVSLSNQPNDVYYSEDRQGITVEDNANIYNTTGHHYYNAQQYQNLTNVQYMQGTPVGNAESSAIQTDTGDGAQCRGNNEVVELNEVIIGGSVPYSNSQGRQEIDIKQIQDHDRTIKLNQSVDDASNTSTFTHSSSVASDTNNVFVSKLQIPNLSAPNKASVNDSVEYSTDSSQVHESFQFGTPINEKLVASNEISSDTFQPVADNIINIITETRDVKVVETDSNDVSVSALETTAKDTVKTDLVNPPVTKVESPKPTPVPVKPTSWAGLFKSSSSSGNNQPVLVPPVEGVKEGSPEIKKESEERDDRDVSPLPVTAAEDKEAKQLGELLSKMVISHASVALQPRGLVNRANWCYINGTLQALVACPPFYNLLKKLPKYPALSRGPSSTPILDSLVEFVHEFHPMPRNLEKGPKKGVRDINPGSPFEPSYVYKMLQVVQVNPHFKLGKQEDAEEFLSCILDGMHEEMSAAVTLLNKNDKSEPVVDGYTNGFVAGETDEDEELDPEAWEQVGPKKKSVQTRRAEFAKTPIADIFAGMIRSVVSKASAKETATLQPFFTLQLDIQSEKVWTVKDALEGFVSKEPISGYTCPKTNTEVEIVKKVSLEELPPVLVLHLKFFVYNKDGGTQKLLKKVDFPVELEITKDLLSPTARNKLNQQQRSYKLFAVVYHHGKTSTGGHYTTSVFHPGINGWIHSDDSTVKTVFVRDVLKYVPQRVPYLLYYRRLDSH